MGFVVVVVSHTTHPHKAIINHFDVLRQYPIFKTLKIYELILRYSCWRTICLRSLVPGFFFLTFLPFFYASASYKNKKLIGFHAAVKNGLRKTNRKKGFQIDLKVLSMKFKRDFCMKIAQFFSFTVKLAAMLPYYGNRFLLHISTSSHGDSSWEWQTKLCKDVSI